MIPVVINADDFGLTEGVCAGIVKAIQAGGVTATTAMACVPGAVERLKRWAPKIPGHIGAHLQLTSGAPVLPPERVPSLVQDGGQFPAIRKQVRARTEEILFEWRAQIELLRCAGIELTHLDSHHHIHRLPAALPAFCELAKQYGLPARALDAETTRSLRTAGVPCVGRTLTDWYGGELSAGSLVNVLNEGRRDSPEAGSFEGCATPVLLMATLGCFRDTWTTGKKSWPCFVMASFSGNLPWPALPCRQSHLPLVLSGLGPLRSRRRADLSCDSITASAP